MRWIRRLSGALIVVLVVGAVADGAIGHTRSGAFAARASDLEATWSRDTTDGVPPSSIAALRRRLEQSPWYGSPWWAPSWATGDGAALISDLNHRTDAAWEMAMNAAHNGARTQITAAQQLTGTDGPALPATTVSDIAAWPDLLAAAQTPASAVALTARWHRDLAIAQGVVAQAKLTAAIADAGGAAGLVAASATAVSTAATDNLDPGDVPALAAALQEEISGGTDAAATSQRLAVALQQLRDVITVNDNVTEAIGPLAWSVAQDVAEQNAGSADAMTSLTALRTAFRDARTHDQMRAVADQTTALQTLAATALAAGQCGHAVPAGRVITINLTVQEGVFYQDGCVVQATPVTTGRPALPTPAGNDRVFYKTSPFVMRSMWPKSSPFWYPDSPVSWVMEFLGGGYFLHDAPWESPGQYGAGSENGGAASHGCIHIPTAVMRWLYGWTSVGTPVIVSA